MQKLKGFALIVCFLTFVNCCGGSGDSISNSPATPNPTPPPAQLTCDDKIPIEQPEGVRHEEIFYSSPPSGYSSAIGWVNITIGSSDGNDGKVEVKSLNLWEEYNGQETLIAKKIICDTCTDPNDKVWGYTIEKSLWQVPSAWSKPNEGMEFQISSEGYIIIPASNHPTRVYHFWHALWPRPFAKQGAKYYLTAEALIEQNAMMQIGIDFYQRVDGGSSVEGMISNWYCSSPSWQTLRVGG